MPDASRFSKTWHEKPVSHDPPNQKCGLSISAKNSGGPADLWCHFADMRGFAQYLLPPSIISTCAKRDLPANLQERQGGRCEARSPPQYDVGLFEPHPA
jgi:hypothetical protein